MSYPLISKQIILPILVGISLLCTIAECTSPTEPPRVINAAGNCTRLKCEKRDNNSVVLQYMSGHAIENHTITSNRTWHSESEGEESECLRRCIRISTCITVLVGKEERKCWFYEGDDVYAHPETIQPKQGYKIVSLGPLISITAPFHSPKECVKVESSGVCKDQPCNNGKCVPNFDGSDRFTCSCDSGYRGDRCQFYGADLHFSFDADTLHLNREMSDLKMELVDGKLIRVPDRRGKVLGVKDGTTTVKMTMTKSTEYGKWLTNPWANSLNLTTAFWLKMDRTVETDAWRQIITFERWRISYNGKQKLLKAFIASHGDTAGNNEKMNVECSIRYIQRWTHVVLAMSGVIKEVKLYVDGELCDSKDVSAVSPDSHTDWGSSAWPQFLFYQNKGASLIDELKFWKTYRVNETAMEDYVKEKKDFMS